MASKTREGGIVQPKCKIPLERDAMVLKYSPNKEHIVAGCSDGVVQVYKSGLGEKIQQLKSDSSEEISITSMKFRSTEGNSEENKLLCSYSNGDIILWQYESGTIIKQINEARQTLGVNYHAKLPKFLTVGDNGAIYLYDEETMTMEQTFEKSSNKERADGHTSRVFTSAFHPYQVNEFLSGGWDDNVHYWDLRQPTSPRFLRGPHICGDGIDFSKTGREILTCAYQKDKAIQLWHYKSGKLMSNLEPDFFKSMLYCGQWLTTDYILTGGTDPPLFRIVSLRSLTCSCTLSVMPVPPNSADNWDYAACQKIPKIAINNTKKSLTIAYLILKTVVSYKGSSTLGVYSTDYFVKNTKSLSLKKEAQSQGEVKFLFSIDRTIMEGDISL